MADALLGAVIQNLRSVFQDELATFWGVDQQTEKLSSNLSRIRAVVKEVERKQIRGDVAQDWLQKLTDAAYVLEDILDECSIHSKKMQCEGQNPCLARFHPKDILFRRRIGKRMKDIAKRFDHFHNENYTFELPSGVTDKPVEDGDEWRQTVSANTEQIVYGRDQEREQIVEFLREHACNSEDLSIYPIVGIGGLGKTTLARQVFNDDRVSEHFHLKIWACVSRNFNTKRILQSIIESTTGQNPNLGDLEAMRKKAQEVLQSKRYLLVLDDVWNEDREKWTQLMGVLQGASATKGAAILVTTRLQGVANIMLEHVASVTELRPACHLVELSEADSWSLFKYHAFGPHREGSEELVAIGEEIVRKCSHLPLAIKTLGSLLRDKSDVRQWQNVKESEIWSIQEEGSHTSEENTIVRVLKLSYINLESSLRRCFSFCAIFPKGSEIVKEELIHLWMANGYIKSEGKFKVEEIGNKVSEKLYQRSFFQEAKADKFGIITSFKMHDLFHDLAKFIMGEECVVYEQGRLPDLSSRTHHLHLLASNVSVNLAALKKVESLRTLLDNVNVSPLPSNSCLRALRTSSSQLSTLMDLTHLRYLNLHWSSVTSLPNSVCGLQKLQTLKLVHCRSLNLLPKDLTRLQDLRHLVINSCPSIAEMPPNIGKLSQLITLSTFIVGSRPGYGLAELHGLKLGGKLHIRGLQNVPSEWDAKQANLKSKKELNRLYLSWGRSANSDGTNVNAEQVLEALKPPSTLKGFGMKGYEGIRLPSWMRNPSFVKDLVDIILYDCKNCEQLPPLGKLPHLKSLFVCGMKDVKHIDSESYDGVEKAFPLLEKFTAWNLPNLESMLRDEGVEMLPCLSQLSIDSVGSLKFPCLLSVEHLEARYIEDGASFMEGVVGNMPCLKTLQIEGFDKLKELPDQLSRLGALQELDIGFWNELESFPEHVLQGLTSLRTMNISNCMKLKSLSKGVGHLACLECLDIVYCPELVDLGENMNQLTALREVRISLSTVPEGLQHIPSLQSLVINCCSSLPDWLGDMTSLRELNILHCWELRSLPSSFQRLTNLSKLIIESCPDELENRCKRETGEYWQYIRHIPQVEVVSFATEEMTYFGSIRSAWVDFKIYLRRFFKLQHTKHHWQNEFDLMVDE